MGGGRAPCCDKSKVKKGPWSPAEDLRLITFIQRHGHGNWRALPKQSGLLRCGKSCRLRWINYLRPDVKRGNFTSEEEETIIKLHQSLGNKWSKIASQMPGRTDNEIKNVWNTHLKKRVIVKKPDHSDQDEAKESLMICSYSPSSSSSSVMSKEDKNMEKGVSDQEGPMDGPKETSSSSCSISSCGSNVSKSNKADVPRPKAEMSSPSNFRVPYCEIQNAIDESANHQELIEIPLEADINFWDMLDNWDSSQSTEPQTQQQEIEPLQNSEIGEKDDKQVECNQWLRYLANELELVGTTGEDQQQNSTKNALVAESRFDELMLMPEIDQGMDYFPMWPPSPPSFDI